jgi:hypothetical protein
MDALHGLITLVMARDHYSRARRGQSAARSASFAGQGGRKSEGVREIVEKQGDQRLSDLRRGHDDDDRDQTGHEGILDRSRAAFAFDEMTD